MNMYLKPVKNGLGAYPAPQATQADGMIPLTEEQFKTVVDHNGFVTITEDKDEWGAVTYIVEPDLEAWEAWKESCPQEPECSTENILDTLLGVRE